MLSHIAMPRRSHTNIIVALALFGLAACSAPRAVAPRGPTGTACLDALARRGAGFERVAEPAAFRGCRLATGVSLSHSRALLAPPATLSCPMALALVTFEEDVIQPTALKYFGRRAAVVRHWGGYSCRGRSSDARRLSQHGLGQAIDLAEFDIEDGPRISVKADWRDAGPRGRFLREIARRACGPFSVVLTPSNDAAHRDHLHFDIGPERFCH